MIQSARELGLQALYPQRIVCLTEETTELLYILEQQHRIVGISGYTVRPPQARKEKPKVSAFISAKINEIIDLKPDLVLGFSDLQADIAKQLIQQGIAVHVFNQRSVKEIYQMILQLGAMVGAHDEALKWVLNRQNELAIIERQMQQFSTKPVVYFEEWYEPIITSIQWVSELVTIAGGKECFPQLSQQSLAKNRIIADEDQVVRANPDIIIGSWCGRKFRPEKVAERKNWQSISALKNNHVYEIKSADILQPGPAALTDGVRQIQDFVLAWQKQQ